MKLYTLVFICLLLVSPIFCQNTLEVYTNAAEHRINKNIYGHFAEHLGRCIYGGIFEEDSPLSNGEGYRKDVIEAVRPLNVSVLRWPGGNFASGYNWRDGIGPRDSRPVRPDHAGGALESNRFGTHLCWMDDEPLDIHKTYWLKQGTKKVRAFINQVEGRIDVNTVKKEQADGLELNDIGDIFIETYEPLFLDEYTQNRAGMLALVDQLEQLRGRAATLSEKRRPRFEERGQLTPRERLHRLLDPGMPLLELYGLANFLVDNEDSEK